MNEGRTGTIGPPMFGRALAGRDGTLCESGAILGENGGRGAGALAVSMRRSISSLMTTERGAPESCITSAISECSSGVHLMAHRADAGRPSVCSAGGFKCLT